MPTLQDSIDRAKRRAGRLARQYSDPSIALDDTDDPVLRDYARNTAIEIAQETSRIKARAEISVSQGSAEHEVARSVGRVLEIIWTPSGQGDGKSLDLIPGERARARAEQHLSAGTEGEVTGGGFYGGSLWLNAPPTTGGTIRLYYIAESLIGETDASFSSDEEPEGDLSDHLPPELEKPLVDGILIQHFEDIGEFEVAQGLKKRYLSMLGSLKRTPRKQRTTTRPGRWLG